MLTFLSFAMIIVFMTLIMTKRMTPMIALILVPTAFAVGMGHVSTVGDMALEGIKDIAPTAALLLFSIAFFAIMLDVGLFDPIVSRIVKFTKSDPLRVTLGTAALTTCIALDGDGSTTFIIVTAAMLPIYKKLGMSPVTLTTLSLCIFSCMNIVPWGGPTARAAAALGIETTDIFVPMIPALIVCIVICFLFAIQFGLWERKQLALRLSAGDEALPDTAAAKLSSGSLVDSLDPNRSTLRPKLLWFNALLTIIVLVLLIFFSDMFPIVFIFMVGTALALVVNFPNIEDQAKAMSNHGQSIINVVSVILAAGVLLGIFEGTGMIEAIANWLTGVIPEGLGGWMAPILGLISIPMTFLVSNDAFYFSIMPIFAEAGAQYGVPAADIARASITGQPFHMQSPLVPALLLFLSLTGVSMSDHHKKALWRSLILCLAMLGTGIVVGSIGIY